MITKMHRVPNHPHVSNGRPWETTPRVARLVILLSILAVEVIVWIAIQ